MSDRQLFVLRHVKSSWADAGLSDHARPLAERGRQSLGRLRRYLTERQPPVDTILCSSAVRAVDTFEGVRPALPGSAAVMIEDDLYGASATTLLDRLRAVPDETRIVMMVGHNPGLEDLVHGLAGDGDRAALERLAHKLPTGALAEIHLDRAWPDLEPGCGYLASFVIPRELPD